MKEVQSTERGSMRGIGNPARTLRYSLLDVAAWSVMSGFGDVYVAPFAIFLDAGNTALAFIGASPFLIGALAQTMGASLADRRHARKPLILAFVTLQALLFLPLFWMPRLFPEHAVGAALACWSLILICAHAAMPPWISMMGDVVPPHRRGDFFGRRGRLSVLVVMLATSAAGGILAVSQRQRCLWTGYGMIFFVAFLARLASAFLLKKHDDPPYHPPREAFFSFFDFLRALRRSNYARFALYNAFMLGAINVASPFFAVYMLRDLEWSYLLFTISNAVFMFTQFLVIRWWGRLGDRYGNRFVIICASFLLPLVPLPWVFSRNYSVLLFGQVLSGVAWSGFTISTQNFTLDAVTSHKRARASSYASILNGAFTMLGGMLLGAQLADRLPAGLLIGEWQITFLSSLPFVFIVSACLRLAGAVLLTYRVGEVRIVETPSPQMLVLRIPGGRAVAGFLSAAALFRASRSRLPRGGVKNQNETPA